MYLLLRADQRLKHNHEDVLLPAHLQELFPSEKELGLELCQIIIRLSLTQCQNNWALFFVVVIDLEKKMERSNSGDYKIIFWTICLMTSGRAQCGGNKKRFQYFTDPSGKEILYLRALQGHSGRNFIDPALQDNVSTPNNFFENIYHIGCAINLHSIMNSGLILERTKFERKTDGIFHVCGSYEQRTQRSNHIDLEAPRLGMYKQKK